MTDNQTIQIARLYGTPIQEKNAEVEYRFTLEQLKMLIYTTITVEREACAKVCDTRWNGDADTYDYTEASNDCAAAIRARGNT